MVCQEKKINKKTIKGYGSSFRLNIFRLLYIWEEMTMMALLHMAGLENSECIWKIQRKPEVVVSVSVTEK
jgi:hypothetical protein